MLLPTSADYTFYSMTQKDLQNLTKYWARKPQQVSKTFISYCLETGKAKIKEQADSGLENPLLNST